MIRFFAALLLLLAMSGCCVHESALVAIDRGISTNAGHMADTRLDSKAHEVATDSYDVFHQIKFSLTGTAVPADVQERKDARDAARTAGDPQ